ncbi:Sorting nexin-25 [Lamellibrachia satsuma]|nr:Sorting nexin-25 [Lamellibrachia satsuma]
MSGYAAVGVSIATAVVVISYSVVTWTVTVALGCVGLTLGIGIVLTSGGVYTPLETRDRIHKTSSGSTVHNLLCDMMHSLKEDNLRNKLKVLSTRNLDAALQQVLDLATRDYVMSWYGQLVEDNGRLGQELRTDLWVLIENTIQRLRNIDFEVLMTQDVARCLTRHFHDIRLSHCSSRRGDREKVRFALHPWLANDETEKAFLRSIAEVAIMNLFPKHYINSPAVSRLLREVFTCKLLKPMVDAMCDPHMINQQLYDWLSYRERLSEEHKQTFTYAANYEGFIRIIDKCMEIEHLRHMRYNIIAEIMQATTIQNLKRAKGLDTDRKCIPKGTTKGHLLRARNLKRYLNQLTVAKSLCEKRIYLLGGPDYKSYSNENEQQEYEYIPGKKVFALSVIVDMAESRNHLMTYLRKTDDDALLRFWMAVETIKQAAEKCWRQLATEAFETFVAPQNSIGRQKLSRSTIHAMGAFLTGDVGPDAFWEAQEQMYHILEEQYYPSFILSDTYHRYISQRNEDRELAEVDSGSSLQETRVAGLEGIGCGLSGGERVTERATDVGECLPGDVEGMDDDGPTDVAHYSIYALQKLQQLNEKLGHKHDALKALTASGQQNHKMLKLQADIRAEIEALQMARRQLEFHIERTELWMENVGQWQAQIYNSEVVEEEDKMVAYFVIVVHLHSAATCHTIMHQDDTYGWVVSRTLAQFHELHRKLIPIKPSLKKQQPPKDKSRKKSPDGAFLDKAKESLNNYLVEVMQDERLAQSEILFTFFSPSPEHLKQSEPTKAGRGTRFSLATLLSSSRKQPDNEDTEDVIFGSDECNKDESSSGVDATVEPLYQLIGEIFELRGLFRWLRRTLMVSVQVTYGRSINRQLRETVDWLISEPMLIYYTHQLRDLFWEEGKLRPTSPQLSPQHKIRVRLLAKQKLLHNIPDALKNLVGEDNARHGTIKVFEALQDVRLNKHVFYALLEQLLVQIFPELNRQLHCPETNIGGEKQN